jgi:hypothetical protein
MQTKSVDADRTLLERELNAIDMSNPTYPIPDKEVDTSM